MQKLTWTPEQTAQAERELAEMISEYLSLKYMIEQETWK